MLSCIQYNFIKLSEVKAAFCGLDVLPCYATKDGVDIGIN
jgi:hypothetical protein